MKILIVIRRYNGDVLLTEPLIRALKSSLNAQIDILINQNTLAVAKTIPFIDNFILFSYEKTISKKLKSNFNLLKRVYKKYDLAINLTANDRNIYFATLAAKRVISVIEKDKKKSWWKRLLVDNYYFLEDNHIVLENLKALEFLGIKSKNIVVKAYPKIKKEELLKKFPFLNKKYIIFHPSAQHNYKIYPTKSRNELLKLLNSLNVPILITGTNSKIDSKISKEIPKLNNIYNLIGETSLDELISIMSYAIAYIGMDTLNMHLAAALNLETFAIFGPTLPHIWSPWSNSIRSYAKNSLPPYQNYGNIHIFQANMSCVACGLAGCDNQGGVSECLYKIEPKFIFNKVQQTLKEKELI